MQALLGAEPGEAGVPAARQHGPVGSRQPGVGHRVEVAVVAPHLRQRHPQPVGHRVQPQPVPAHLLGELEGMVDDAVRQGNRPRP